VLVEGERCYTKAHARARGARVRSIFDLRRAERATFARVLRQIATDAEIDVEMDHAAGADSFLDRCRTEEGAVRDREIVASCMRADAAAVTAFDHALAEIRESVLDERERAVIQFQRAAIAASLAALTVALQAS
jgi:hypothetical protein